MTGFTISVEIWTFDIRILSNLRKVNLRNPWKFQASVIIFNQLKKKRV